MAEKPKKEDAKSSAAPPPSPAARAVMAQNISSSLAPPPRAGRSRPNIEKPTAAPIAQTEMQRTSQSKQPKPPAAQELSVEIDMGDGNLASRRNPITERGQRISDSYISKTPHLQKPYLQNADSDKAEEKDAQKEEPAVVKPQARQLSAGAARLIAKRRAMMEGQDQAGSFKFPGQDQDPTESS